MVIITEDSISLYVNENKIVVDRLIKKNQILFLNCINEMEKIWTYTKYDIHTSGYNTQMMELLMKNLYKNFFYVKRNMRIIQRRFDKEDHMRRHQELKDQGEIDSDDSDSE